MDNAPDSVSSGGVFDRFMPRYHFSERHQIYVDAPQHVAFNAVAATDITDSAIARILLALWRFPTRLLLRESLNRPISVRDLLVLSHDSPTSLVRGIVVGRISRSQAREITPQEFPLFDKADCFKSILGFHVTPQGDGALVQTETRAWCTSGLALMVFAPYWAVVRLPSGLIRRRLLAHIKRKSESRDGF